MQDERLPVSFVPNLEMTFGSFDEAYEFYRKYAEKASFPIKKDKIRTCGQDITCSREGGTSLTLRIMSERHPKHQNVKGARQSMCSTSERWCQCLLHTHRATSQSLSLRTMCGSRTGGWSLPCVMSD
jgi:hypothetical protein